jgi:hypothetical protein
MPTFYIEPSLSSYKNTGGLCGLKFIKKIIFSIFYTKKYFRSMGFKQN